MNEITANIGTKNQIFSSPVSSTFDCRSRVYFQEEDQYLPAPLSSPEQMLTQLKLPPRRFCNRLLDIDFDINI